VPVEGGADSPVGPLAAPVDLSVDASVDAPEPAAVTSMSAVSADAAGSEGDVLLSAGVAGVGLETGRPVSSVDVVDDLAPADGNGVRCPNHVVCRSTTVLSQSACAVGVLPGIVNAIVALAAPHQAA
jgi:hypothetical protein